MRKEINMWKGNMWKEHVEINIGKETCEKKHRERGN